MILSTNATALPASMSWIFHIHYGFCLVPHFPFRLKKHVLIRAAFNLQVCSEKWDNFRAVLETMCWVKMNSLLGLQNGYLSSRENDSKVLHLILQWPAEDESPTPLISFLSIISTSSHLGFGQLLILFSTYFKAPDFFWPWKFGHLSPLATRMLCHAVARLTLLLPEVSA